MFSKEMEALIEATLADGVLTDQEKTALINRAEKEGVDLNELEIYIQSILQKRQQELDKKSREARAQQEEADLESEKLRAKTLRVCPKCGAQIPHLSNACPDCGFVINKTEQDEELVVLIGLLGKSLELLDYYAGEFCLTDYVKISKKQFDRYSRFGKIDEEINEVQVNYAAVKAEAFLYKNNIKISDYLNKLHLKEKELIIDYIKLQIKNAKEYLEAKYIYIPHYEDYLERANKHFRKLKSDYSDCSVAEIEEIEELIKKVENKYAEIESSPNFRKRATRDRNVIRKWKNTFWENLRERWDDFLDLFR